MNYMLMNAQMALATQQGIKTQTRRDAKRGSHGDYAVIKDDYCSFYSEGKLVDHVKLKYKVGQKLWIREPAKVIINGNSDGCDAVAVYLSDGAFFTFDINKYPSLQKHYDMWPKWLSEKKGMPNGCIKEMARTFVIITDIRVERLDDIEYEDILAEGFPMDYEPKSLGTKTYFADTHGEIDYEEDRANEWFTNLIESISGKGSFDDRWVFVYEYKTITKEDAGI